MPHTHHSIFSRPFMINSRIITAILSISTVLSLVE
ncbi:hypothetical protein DSUL_60277 [Desulfovibrionales bacterium]